MKKKYALFLLPLAVLACGVALIGETVPGEFLLDERTEEGEDHKFEKARLAKEAAEFRLSRLKDENGNFYPAYLFRALEEADALSAGRSGALNLQWEELGPDNVGGRVRAILIDKRDPSRNTIYAGGVSGGLWKSTDGANTWTRLEWNEFMSISCIAQGPAPGYRILVGTGESLGQIGSTSLNSGQIGNGIYELNSNDQPVHLPSTAAHTAGDNLTTASEWHGVNRIAINPNDPNIIFAATAKGLLKSTDGGNSWTQVTGPNIAAGQFSCDVKISPSGQYVYAALGSNFGANTLIRSTDSGFSFSRITSTTNPGWPASGVGRIEIAVAPGDDTRLFVLIATPSGDTKGVYKSLNNGATWELEVAKGPTFNPFGGQTQGWYDNVIAVSTGDPNKVYLGGVDFFTGSGNSSWQRADVGLGGGESNPNYIHPDKHAIAIDDLNPDIMYIGNDGGVYKSTNALSAFPYPTYRAKNRGFNVTQFYSMAADYYGNVMGGTQDNGTQYIDQQGNSPMAARAVYGGDGIYTDFSVLDPRVSFAGVYFGEVKRSANYTQSYSTFFDIKIDPAGGECPTVCNNPCDNGAALFITPFYLGETRTAFNSVDEYVINNDFIVKHAQFVATQNYNAGDVVTILSNTAKIPFTHTLTGPLNAGDTLRISDPIKSRMFISTNCGVWMTPDALEVGNIPKWFKLNTTSTGGNVTISTPLSFAMSSDGNILYVGAGGGRVYKFTGLNTSIYRYPAGDFTPIGGGGPSYLDGLTMQTFTIPGFGGRNVEGVAIDPNNDDHVIAVCSGFASTGAGRVAHTLDGGASWQNVTGDFPNVPAYDCVISAANSNHYIVGTEIGIFTSDNQGTAWTEDHTGMHRVPVFRLRQQRLYDDNCWVVYAATHGRGMWRTTTLTASGCNTSSVKEEKTEVMDFNFYPNPVVQQATVELELKQAAEATLQVMDLTGRLLNEKRAGKLGSGQNKIRVDLSALPAGSYIATVTLNGKQHMSKVFQKR